jgi:hypothetical protein
MDGAGARMESRGDYASCNERAPCRDNGRKTLRLNAFTNERKEEHGINSQLGG